MRRYKNLKGLQTGVHYALKRQGIEVSRWVGGRASGHRTDGVGTTIGYEALVLELVGKSTRFTWGQVSEALNREGFELSKELRHDKKLGTIEVYFIDGSSYCDDVDY